MTGTLDLTDPIGGAVPRLSELTPAECLVLLDPDKADAKDLIKASLQHLLAKQAIRFERREEKTLFLRRSRSVPYLIYNPRLTDFQPTPHEGLLLTIIKREYDMTLQRFAETVARRLRKAKRFKDRYVLPEMMAAGLVERRRRFLLFKSNHLTSSGQNLKKQLDAFRKLSPAEIIRWPRAERDKIQKLLTVMGTNIIIMPELLEAMSEAFDEAAFFSAEFNVEFDFSPSDFSSFDTSFDALGSSAFDGGGGGGGGEGGGGGGDGGGGGG